MTITEKKQYKLLLTRSIYLAIILIIPLFGFASNPCFSENQATNGRSAYDPNLTSISIVADKLNVRKENNTDSEIISSVWLGETVAVVDINDNWAKINWRDFTKEEIQEGWVYAAYFDPCNDSFDAIHAKLDKGVSKYHYCRLPDNEERKNIRDFLKEFLGHQNNDRFLSSLNEQNLLFFKKHSGEKMLYESNDCGGIPYKLEIDTKELKVSNFKEKIWDIWSSINLITLSSDCNREQTCSVISEYDPHYGIIDCYKNTNCGIVFRDDWIIVFYSFQGTISGAETIAYFKKTNDIWKLVRVYSYTGC